MLYACNLLTRKTFKHASEGCYTFLWLTFQYDHAIPISDDNSFKILHTAHDSTTKTLEVVHTHYHRCSHKSCMNTSVWGSFLTTGLAKQLSNAAVKMTMCVVSPRGPSAMDNASGREGGCGKMWWQIRR